MTALTKITLSLTEDEIALVIERLQKVVNVDRKIIASSFADERVEASIGGVEGREQWVRRTAATQTVLTGLKHR